MPSVIRKTALHRLPSVTISWPARTVRLTDFKSSRPAASLAIGGSTTPSNLGLRGAFDRPAAVASLTNFTPCPELFAFLRLYSSAPAAVALLPRCGRFARSGPHPQKLTQ